jgi:hypothetical protein
MLNRQIVLKVDLIKDYVFSNKKHLNREQEISLNL